MQAQPAHFRFAPHHVERHHHHDHHDDEQHLGRDANLQLVFAPETGRRQQREGAEQQNHSGENYHQPHVAPLRFGLGKLVLKASLRTQPFNQLSLLVHEQTCISLRETGLYPLFIIPPLYD